MDKLHKILTSLTPVREYRIKFAFEPDAKALSKITDRLNDRYDATEITPVVKTIFQVNPIDFPELECGEIWMFDFKCTRPVSPHVLRYEIGSLLSVLEQYIVVRSTEEPYEREMEDDLELDEYIPKITDGDFKDTKEYDINEYAGQDRANKAVQDALDRLKTPPHAYSKYMAAGYKKD